MLQLDCYVALMSRCKHQGEKQYRRKKYCTHYIIPHAPHCAVKLSTLAHGGTRVRLLHPAFTTEVASMQFVPGIWPPDLHHVNYIDNVASH